MTKHKPRPIIVNLAYQLLATYPDREMRASDVCDWYVSKGTLPTTTWKQDFSKALSALVRSGKAVQSSRDRFAWYALRLDAPTPGRRRTHARATPCQCEPCTRAYRRETALTPQHAAC